MRAALLALLFLTGCAANPDPIVVAEGSGPVYFITPHGEPMRLGAGERSAIAEWFGRADGDHDRRMTQAEFVADGARFFSEVDEDDDGLATSVEVSALRRRETPQLEQLFAYAQSIDEPRARRRSQYVYRNGQLLQRRRPDRTPARLLIASLLREREPVMAADLDFNRRVTREEFASVSEERFRLLDEDRNNALTLEELELILARRSQVR
ncbi:MAG: hypothetical protein AB7T08_05755 [Hyphomonadaceae bacterium]